MDFGFILRDNILLNNVASPIKFVEYISMGVIPIISEGVGDYSSIVKKSGIGILVNEDNTFEYGLIEKHKSNQDIYDKLYNLSECYTWNNALQNSSILHVYNQKQYHNEI
jgi:glycosyltransferase involved in cell wall biosynthesis